MLWKITAVFSKSLFSAKSCSYLRATVLTWLIVVILLCCTTKIKKFSSKCKAQWRNAEIIKQLKIELSRSGQTCMLTRTLSQTPSGATTEAWNRPEKKSITFLFIDTHKLITPLSAIPQDTLKCNAFALFLHTEFLKLGAIRCNY